MRYENIHNINLPKIGFGTWTIGGQVPGDHSNDDTSLLALRSALELGYIHFDTAEGYAAGHSEELLGQAVREVAIQRETLFIASKVSRDHLEFENVLHCCENSLRRLGMDYLDLYLIHWPQPGMHLEDTFRALNRLVQDGKVRHLGVCNFDLELLRQAVSLSNTPMVTDQVPYNIQDRTYADNGVLGYCQQNKILLTAWNPVKRVDFNTSAAVHSIAQSHGATLHQVALAWLTTQPCVITIPMSFNPDHQAENFRASDLILSEEEMMLLG